MLIYKKKIFLADAFELLECVQDCLDDLWKQTEHDDYPQSRMVNLLTVIGNFLSFSCVKIRHLRFLLLVGDEICRFAQRRIDTDFPSLWEGSFFEIRKSLKNAIALCDWWFNVCDTLTSRLWKQYPSHPWKGEVYKASYVRHVIGRFQEVRYCIFLNKSAVFVPKDFLYFRCLFFADFKSEDSSRASTSSSFGFRPIPTHPDRYIVENL